VAFAVLVPVMAGGFPARNANALGVKEQTEAMNARSRVYENMQLDSHEKGIGAPDRLWENKKREARASYCSNRAPS